MGINAKIRGVRVDVIRCFKYQALVQEVESKEVYLVEYDEFDPATEVRYNRDLADSNVVSLEDWVRRWQKKKLKTRQRRKRLLGEAAEPQ